MATFVEDLWNSIFTPGPTPTLLLATNVSFGALQVVLFFLLIATHSIHFVILSGICGGLWWAINWFAAEVAAFRKEEEQRAQADKAKSNIKETNEANQTNETKETKGVEDKTENKEPDIDESPSESQHEEIRKNEAVSDTDRAASSTAIETDDARPRLVSSPSSGNISADSDWERIETVEK